MDIKLINDIWELIKDFLDPSESLTKQIGYGISIAYVLFRIGKEIRLYQRQRYLEKDLHPFYTRREIDKALRYYIPTKYQETPPSQGEEPGRAFMDSPKAKLVPMFLKKAFKNDDHRFYLILADSGMGKTTFMINLYLRYKRKRFWRRPKHEIRLLPLGNPRTFDEIKNIKNQDNTILLLDALDEDSLALENYGKRITELLDLVWRFREVVITSRTQFFPSRIDEPHETGMFRHGTDGGEHYFRKSYLSVFDDQDITKYLLKRYHYNPFKVFKFLRAQKIVKKSPNLMVRPMLLSYIEDLEKGHQEFDFAFQIYEVLIDQWVKREARKPGIKEKYGSLEKFEQKLLEFSQKLAVNIYQNKERRGGLFILKDEVLPDSEMQILDLELDSSEDKVNLQIMHSSIRSRSLLNRDVEGKYKFSHKSILEYFLAKEAFENEDFLQALQVSGLDAANNFLLNMILADEMSRWNVDDAKMSTKDVFRRIMKVQISSEDAWVDLARVYRKVKDYKKAKVYARKAVSTNKNNKTAWRLLGNLYYDRKNYDEALKHYNKALEIDEKYVYALGDIGDLYRSQKNYDKSLRHYRKALEIDKKYVYAWNRIGHLYRDQRDYDEALRYYKKALEIDKKYVYAWNGIGDLYHHLKKYDEALRHYNKTLEIDKKNVYAWVGLGDIYRDHKNYKDALTHYDKALEIDKKYVYAWACKGDLNCDQKIYDKALKYYKKALEIDKEYVYACTSIGDLYRHQKNNDEALKHYKKALEIDRKYIYAWISISHLYHDQKRYDEAIRQYDKALRIDEKNYMIWGNLGFFHLVNKEPGLAKNCLEKAIQLSGKESEHAYMNLGHYHLISDRPTDALDCYSEGWKIVKDVPRLKQSYYEGLVEDFEELLSLYGINEIAYKKLIEQFDSDVDEKIY